MNLSERLAADPAYLALKAAFEAAREPYRQAPNDPALWPPVEAAREAVNAYYHAARLALEAESAAVVAARFAAVERHLAAFSPMAAGRRRKALVREFRFDGAVMPRFEKIEALQREGWRLVDAPSGRRIESPCGRYFAPDELSGFGLDYFASLSAA